MTLEELRGRIDRLAQANMEKLCFHAPIGSDMRPYCQGFADACEHILQIIREALDGV